ncbi:MAG: hypothetical protein LUB61_03975 [Eggerthellaceae bacterium]|nr:hypothetical protein [Eggerthellaceae bacterium]
MLEYSPYVAMANVLIWGEDRDKVAEEARSIYVALVEASKKSGNNMTILEPLPCVLEKLRKTYRWHIVIKAPVDSNISGVLTGYFRGRKANRHVNAAVDVNPVSLL